MRASRISRRWLDGESCSMGTFSGFYGYGAARSLMARRLDGGRVPSSVLRVVAIHLIGFGVL